MSYKLYLQIELNEFPKSLNKKLRSHFHKNNRENKLWDLLIAVECKKKGIPPTPLNKASLTIIRHSDRFLDYDGLVGSMKPVVDALVSCKVLIDDKWSVLGKWNVDQRFRPKKDKKLLEILIQELPTDLSS